MEPDTDYCNWCGEDIPAKRKDRDYCSRECGEADYRDWKATERDKWGYYNEV